MLAARGATHIGYQHKAHPGKTRIFTVLFRSIVILYAMVLEVFGFLKYVSTSSFSKIVTSSDRKYKSFNILIRSREIHIYLYINYNRSCGTRCKARAVNIEIIEGELEPGDTWEIYSNSQWISLYSFENEMENLKIYKYISIILGWCGGWKAKTGGMEKSFQRVQRCC